MKIFRGLEVAGSRALSLSLKEGEGDVSLWGRRGWKLIAGDKSERADDFETLAEAGFRNNAIVSACVREMATSTSEAQIHAYRPSKEHPTGWERIEGHAAASLIEMPNLRDSGLEMVERSIGHFILAGNFFWEKIRAGSGRLDALIPVQPDRVLSAITDIHGVPVAYRIRKRSKKGISSGENVVDATDIVHAPDIDPLNEVFGWPRLASAYLALRSDNEADGYVGEVLMNHGTPALIVEASPTAGDPELDRAERRFERKFGRQRGRGKVGFIPGARTLHEIGFSLKELEFPSLRRVTAERICATIGPVDPILIGLSSAGRGSTLSGAEMEGARRKLWVQTLIPMIRRFEAVFARSLAWEWGDDIRLFFATDEIAALQEDRKEAFERVRLMKEAGAFTVPEVRSEGGFDPEPEGEFFLRNTSTVEVPIDEEVEPDPAQGDGADDGTDGGSGDAEGDDVEKVLHGQPLHHLVDFDRAGNIKNFRVKLDFYRRRLHPGARARTP